MLCANGLGALNADKANSRFDPNTQLAGLAQIIPGRFPANSPCKAQENVPVLKAPEKILDGAVDIIEDVGNPNPEL